MELNDIFPVISSSVTMFVLWKYSESSCVLHNIYYGSHLVYPSMELLTVLVMTYLLMKDVEK